MTGPSPRIRLERRIAAPPQVVFRYLTESDLWARWQGDSAELEPVVGGRFRVTMAEGPTAEGRYLAIEPHERVVISWGWRDYPDLPPGASRVEFELRPDGDGTILRLTHTDLPVAEVEIHRRGWRHFVPRLVRRASARR